MNLTKNYTTQSPYTKGVQQPQNNTFTTPRLTSQPLFGLTSVNKHRHSELVSESHKDVFVRTVQPSFKGIGESGIKSFLAPPFKKAVDEFLSNALKETDPARRYQKLCEIPSRYKTSYVEAETAKAARKHPSRQIQNKADGYDQNAAAKATTESMIIALFNREKLQISLAIGHLINERYDQAFKILNELSPEIGYTRTAFDLRARAARNHSDPKIRNTYARQGRLPQNEDVLESTIIVKIAEMKRRAGLH